MATITSAVNDPKFPMMANLTITMDDGTIVTKMVLKNAINTLALTQKYLSNLERVKASPSRIAPPSVSTLSFLNGAKSV